MRSARDLQRKKKAGMHHIVCLNSVEAIAPVTKLAFRHRV
jgi:hypothetical protein